MEIARNNLEIRCKKCGKLLAIKKNGKIEVMNGKRRFLVLGKIDITCDRCREVTTYECC